MDNLWMIYHNWLVVEQTPLKNMSSSVGMMNFPIYGKIKNVPKHQPVSVKDSYVSLPEGRFSLHGHWKIMEHPL